MEDYSWKKNFETCFYSKKLLNFLHVLNKKVSRKVNVLEVQKAIYYAKIYHGTQKRQSGEPYYSHPLEVAYMLAEYTAHDDKQYYRTDLLVSSVLHDTIEDTPLTKEMIETIFGELVANQVESLTRIKIDRKITSEELVNLLLSQEDKGLLMIKMFDRLHNIQTLEVKSPEKIKKIIDETIRVFLLLSTYLEMPQIKNLLLKFCYKYSQIKPSVYSLANIESTFSKDNFQLPFLKIQNDVDQRNILKL
jgi:(p)ppGpp synthase/HD superfamily hydrolase